MSVFPKKVALLVGADLSNSSPIRGGVVVVASFIRQQLLNSGRYNPYLISMATSYNDKASIRLLSPSTWFKEPKLIEGEWNDIPLTHAGAVLSEFEFQRYRPRKNLTNLLNQFDLVQVVSGTPAIGAVTQHVTVPVCLFTATITEAERKISYSQKHLFRRLHNFVVLPIISEIEKQTLNQLHHVFAETIYTKQSILPYISEEKISVDTVGVDIHKFSPTKTRSDNYILCTGRLSDPRKNVKMLFRAYAHLRQNISNVPKLILAGLSGPTESDWDLAKKLKILEDVEFRSQVPIEELVTLYQNAAFFVLSSDEEGLGIVILEAMACGTPVVATRCGGPDSIVLEEAGFLTPVGDAEAMAEKMIWMLSNPSHRRFMGQAARQMVEMRFSNDVVGKKYLDIYDKLLGIQ